jgi:hypothetical protein
VLDYHVFAGFDENAFLRQHEEVRERCFYGSEVFFGRRLAEVGSP